MSYSYDRDKMPTIHPDLGKFDFVVAKDKREWAQCKGIGSKEWIEFANLMFEQFPFIYNTCLLMNDQQKSQQSTIDRLTEQRDRLLGHLKMAALAADEFWHEHYPECINSITSIIAEIEAKND